MVEKSTSRQAQENTRAIDQTVNAYRNRAMNYELRQEPSYTNNYSANIRPANRNAGFALSQTGLATALPRNRMNLRQ